MMIVNQGLTLIIGSEVKLTSLHFASLLNEEVIMHTTS
jgi:hypothetical protein